MAFANLFANLASPSSPGEPMFTCREKTAEGTRRKAGKRKAKEEQPGSYIKKQRCVVQTTTTCNFNDNNMKARGYHTPSTDSAFGGYTKDEISNHHHKAAPNIWHSKGEKSGHKQQHQKKKMKWQKNQHKPTDKGRYSYRGGRAMMGRGGRRHQYTEQMKPPRFMTQEFSDQNVLKVDGRLLCRHFIFGRCIKGDSCQMEHVQGYNDLIKSVCKYYVQGFCTKGESCPYMHKSFPCKHFHKKGKCFQGADCKFSHEPLNDVTNRLLDEALKRDSDLSELAKKTEQESSGEQPNTAESDVNEMINEAPDVLTLLPRPNFYNSTDAPKETLLCPTEEQPDVTVEVFLPHASDAAPPQSPPSTSNKEPVCYSVEAVLGPQLYRPLPSLFTAPGSQESTSVSVPQTSSEATLDTTDQSNAPYSVDSVLRSFKSLEKSPFGQSCTTTTVKTVSYTPKTDCEKSTDPLLNSQHDKILLNTRDEANKSQQKMFKSLPSLQMRTGLISETCPDLLLTSEDHRNQCGDAAESFKTAQRTSNGVKLELLGSPVTQVERSASSQSKGDMKPSPTCPPAQLKPHLSALTSDLQSSVKPFSPSAGFSEFKGRAKVESVCFDAKNDSSESSSHFDPKRRSECGLKPGTLQLSSAKTSPEHSKEVTVGCKKNQKIAFHSLFANPISNSVTPAHPQGFIQNPRCADMTSKDPKTAAEPGKPPSTSFLSLFAAPLVDTAASAPCLQSQADYSKTFHSSKRRASSPPCVAGTDATQTPHRPTSPNFSSSSKSQKVSVSQPVNPVCRLVSDSLAEIPTSPAPLSLNPSVTSAQKELPDISSPRDSVLKSLFVGLSPYQEDRKQRDSFQISLPPD